MTIRAVILGLLLGGGIAAVEFFNHMIMSQTSLTGSHLPPGIFGVLLLMVIIVNPLWWLIRRRPLFGMGEMLTITTIGLAACAWPGGHLMRFAPQALILPTWQIQSQSSWQAQHVLGYVPGGPATLAPGHVRDWRALGRHILEQAEQAPGGLSGRLWASLSPDEQAALRAAVRSRLDSSSPRQIARHINAALRRAAPPDAPPITAGDVSVESDLETIVEARNARRNRAELVKRWPDLVLPAPRGQGVLVNADRARPSLVARYVQGAMKTPSLGDLPWQHWAGPLLNWGLLIGGLGIGTLCLAVIVHPQWANRELLPYPIARFAVDLTNRSSGHRLPELLRSRMFILGFGIVLGIHLLNMINAWFPSTPAINLVFDFSALALLFPHIAQAQFSETLFQPRLLLSMIAFAYFLRTEVSFSLGISHWIYLIFTAWLLQLGYTTSGSSMDPVPGTMFRFGAYLGLALLVIYSGRRYFRDVLLAASHIRPTAAPRPARWAARLFALASLVTVFAMYRMGLHPLLAVLFVLLVYICWLCAGRIVAETGFFLLQTRWMAIGVIIGLIGEPAVGPTNAIILALGSVMCFTSINETIMPHLLHGMYCTDRARTHGHTRIAPWQGLMAVAALVIAAAATIWIVHTHGASTVDDYNRLIVPASSFNWFTGYLSELSGAGQLFEASAMTTAQRLGAIAPDGLGLAAAAAGVLGLFGLALGRQRLPWWPLHPVVLLVMGTWSAGLFSISILIGWLIKFSTVRLAGVRAYHTGRALMVGVIAGEITAAALSIIIGAIYYALTRMPPPEMKIMIG